MAENIKQMLVVSDIDGTLLRAGCGIPLENMDAVERFVERGGRFTVATGRMEQSVRGYLPWLPLSAPAVLCGGALIYDFESNKALYERTLESGARELVRELMEQFPKLGIEVCARGDSRFAHECRRRRAHAPRAHALHPCGLRLPRRRLV
ncbi:MAG: HAD hydrolase family protein [Oscillospiraceae bacterium]|nr:HAD hydrolase family protein [Oscillospiraceae bacterium]